MSAVRRAYVLGAIVGFVALLLPHFWSGADIEMVLPWTVPFIVGVIFFWTVWSGIISGAAFSSGQLVCENHRFQMADEPVRTLRIGPDNFAAIAVSGYTYPITWLARDNLGTGAKGGLVVVPACTLETRIGSRFHLAHTAVFTVSPGIVKELMVLPEFNDFLTLQVPDFDIQKDTLYFGLTSSNGPDGLTPDSDIEHAELDHETFLDLLATEMNVDLQEFESTDAKIRQKHKEDLRDWRDTANLSNPHNEPAVRKVRRYIEEEDDDR
jgi:hypothetical protein